jgi:hypothetical protein
MNAIQSSWRHDACAGQLHFEASCQHAHTHVIAVSFVDVLRNPGCNDEIKRMIAGKLEIMIERRHPSGQ